jgi:23S rRNA (pseudouridine1915-N3)-methyltransferase
VQCNIVSVGKWKSGPEKALFEHYGARLPWKITLKELDTKKFIGSDNLKAKEADLLLAACKDSEMVWALDEAGKSFSSSQFAQQLGRYRDDGIRGITFIIGGADGLHESVHKRANHLFSLGKVTWPHLLVRALLAEQLYRAHTILSGHPYHRE